MTKQRTDRLNSLLREVISDVIRLDLKNPHVSDLITVMGVDITKDLRQAKVFISVIGSNIDKQETMIALDKSAGFIASTASKKVRMRYFPTLHFVLDDGVNHQMRIEELLQKIHNEEQTRHPTEESSESEPE